jgi:inosine-uridine nucleoside N-ribohydrolase
MRTTRRVALGVVVLAVLLLLSFALPIEEWRTGELAVAPLPTVRGGPRVVLPPRIWIDTDAGCGVSRTTDPDDCFAILLLAGAASVRVVGISTVHGNAPVMQTDSVAQALATRLADRGGPVPRVFRGSGDPDESKAAATSPPAHAAIRNALSEGPLRLVALGPLTNLAAAIAGRPDLQRNVRRLVAVMGRRPGHLFHPAEGESEGGILFGHGPVFSDFNYEQDRRAAALVFGMALPTTLIPYDVARQVLITRADLTRLKRNRGAAAWVAERAGDWLDYWADDIGLPGFYPFDLLAAAYVLAPERFDCAEAEAEIRRDLRLWGRLWGPWAVLVQPKAQTRRRAGIRTPVVYCERVAPGFGGLLTSRLTQ